MKWISVDNYLPSEEKRVLICLQHYLSGNPNGKKFHDWICIARYYSDIGWKLEVDCDRKIYDKIIFWKNLPDIPN